MSRRVEEFIDRWSTPDRLLRVVAALAVLAALTSAVSTIALVVGTRARNNADRVDREGIKRDQLTRADVERIIRRILALERPPRGEIRRRFEVGLSQCLDNGTCRRRIARALGVAVSPRTPPGRLLDRVPNRRRRQGSSGPRSGGGGTTTPGDAPSPPATSTPAAPPIRPVPAPAPTPQQTPGGLVDDLLAPLDPLLPDLRPLLP